MKDSKRLVLVGLLIFISIIFSLLVMFKFMLCDNVELNSYLTVGDHLGFNIDADAIYFGTVPIGASSNRDVYINNTKCDKVKVIIKTEGEIKDWIKVSNNNFILSKNEAKSVNFAAYVPDNAELRNYSAKVKIYLWKTI